MSQKSGSLIDINDLNKGLKIISENWLIMVLFLGISYILAYVYIHKLTEYSAAKTQILIKSEETYDYQSQIMAGLGQSYNYYSSYEKISNEMRVIKSYDLIEKAVSKLNLDVSYYIVGRLKTTEIYESKPFQVVVSSINPGLYEQTIKLNFIDDKRYRLKYERYGESVVHDYFFDREAVDTDFKIVVTKNSGIDKNSALSLKDLEYQFKVHKKSNLITKYQSTLSVENEEYTAILTLLVEDEIPERAVLFLDTLSKVYLDYSLKSKVDINENTLRYIDKQLDEVIQILSQIEDDLENYKKKKSILDLTKEEDSYFQQLTDFESQKTKLELQLQTIGELEKYIILDKDPELLPPSFYINNEDDFLKKSVGELYAFQIARNGALFNSTVKNMSITEIDQKIKLLKNNILTYLGNTKVAIQDNINRVTKAINTYEGSIQNIPQKQRQLLNIARKQQVYEKMYSFLLEKKSSTIIAKAGIVPETKIIESARSIGVVKPDKTKILYSFLGGSLILSLIIVFIRTAFFSRIESVQELKALTTLPILGEILFSKAGKSSYIVVDADPKSPITESFRSMRTNLEYMASNSKSKLVIITSNNPGEGKTFCSINLASILAKAGKKVLIIELDLHKPKVHLGLNMKSEFGVSNILIGKESTKNSILKTSIENLDTILAGPTPPNASELILSQHMLEMLDYGRENYDYVVVDTPPVGLISDAFILMKYADISLFVLNVRFATKGSVNNAHEIVELNKLQNFGFVLNGVREKKSKYYYNRYSYGYGFGYGYGYGYGKGYGYGGYYGYGQKSKKDKGDSQELKS
ncbi:MAG: polysaccharide biosynthesis tyrosine autokinase [Bacteroidetes bacterium]|nr:polysaccharide biosynthesis tyrosine autokinase [Bacteroidota bacterium]